MNKYVTGLYFVLRILVGLLFLYSGYQKIIEPSANFEAVILAYGIFPETMVSIIVFIMPWLEFILGGFLFLGYAPRVSGFIMALFSFVFIISLVYSRIKTGVFPLDCGCFGEGPLHFSTEQMLLVDLFGTWLGLRLFMILDHPLSLGRFLTSSTP